MATTSRAVRTINLVFIAALLQCAPGIGSAQITPPAPKYPARLPYSFSNFVWWSNGEIGILVKSRVPDLGDEIAPESAMEGKVRDALTAMLKEKGIAAEVQSEEPSNFALTAERAPGSPAPGIVFSILSPQILVDKVIVSQAPEALAAVLNEKLQQREGHEYTAGQDWLIHSKAEEAFAASGYLEGQIGISHDAPRREEDHYLVNLLVSVTSGPQYRIGSISADCGPLLKGRDFSSHFAQKVGDIAGAAPFGRLPAELRGFYWHYGYADVEIHGPPVLDRSQSIVSYHLEVVPGPLYHLRSLTINNLNAEQKSRARELLGLKPGDIFDEMAINGLSHKLCTDPTLAGYGFVFNPVKDKATAQVDLALNFYKVSDKSSVTVK